MATFLDLTRELATDDSAKAEFGADADGFLAARGWGGLDPADLGDALGHAVDALPATAAVQLPPAESLAAGEVAPGDALQRLAEVEPPVEDAPVGIADTGAEGDLGDLAEDATIELDTTYEIADDLPDWVEDAVERDDGLGGLGDDLGDGTGEGPSTDHGDPFDLG